MDMPSLLLWRAVCRASCGRVTRVLQSTMHHMVRRYLPCPRDFLRILRDCRAVLGGIFALAFMLRDDSIISAALDVFIDENCFPILLEYLTYSPFVSPHVVFDRITAPTPSFRHQRDIRRCARFITATGRKIHIHESRTVSCYSPIGRSWTTALMNFVTEDSFSCAYPRLTLSRRALFSELTLESLTDDDYENVQLLLSHGFLFALHSSHWPEYRVDIGTRQNPHTVPCMRHLYLCPDQGRYFGDPGSLFAFICPLTHNHTLAYATSRPPYGYMTVWRLWTMASCDNGCAYTDGILPGGVISMPLFLVADPIFSRLSLSATETLPSSSSFTGTTVSRRNRAYTV